MSLFLWGRASALPCAPQLTYLPRSTITVRSLHGFFPEGFVIAKRQINTFCTCLPKAEEQTTRISALLFLPSRQEDLGPSTTPSPADDLQPRAKSSLNSLCPSHALSCPNYSSRNGLSPRCSPFLLLNFISI